MKLQEISRLHFQQVLNANIDKPRTCEQIALTFRQVIKSAIADRLLPDAAYKDICDGISLAKYKSPAKRPLTALEKKAIKEADFTDRERCFVYLIYGLGLRREEALALCRTDISMKSRSVRIHSAVVFDKNNPVSKCPKSENGYRDVPMPDFLYIPTGVPTRSRWIPDPEVTGRRSHDEISLPENVGVNCSEDQRGSRRE